MGVVTVFVSDECADSQLVLKLFRKHTIPFQTLNVDTYPRKRALMIKRADCLTTPHVFFNQKHIGGAKAVKSLLERYDQEAQKPSSPTVYERIYREVLIEYESPIDSQMFKLTSAERSDAIILSHQDDIDRKGLYDFDFVQVTEKVKISICKVSRDLLQWLPRKNNRMAILFKSSHQTSSAYKTYYSGSEVINTLMKHYNFLSSDRAVVFGQELLNLGVIHRIGKDRLVSNLFCAKGSYRLQSLRSSKILNSFRTWNERTGLNNLSLHPILTLSRLLRQMTEILTSATNDAGIVDYCAARKNPKFRDFEEAVCELQLVNIKDIDDENTKKTFFINTYNLMEKHAFVKFCPKKVKKGMFDKVQYIVWGYIFSMGDIYHGVLRKNSKHPKSHTKLLSESDPRIYFSMQKIDARIHFALNSANQAILYEYHKDAINEELRIAAELYCKSNKRLYISGEKNKVIFPKFMKTFVSDAATNRDTRSLFESVTKYLRKDSFRLRELNKMLERERTNDERVTVLFKNNLSPKRRNRLRTIMSCVRLLKRNTPSVTKNQSIDTEEEGSINSPLRKVIRSPTPWTSDLTWDCEGGSREYKEPPLIKESSEFTLTNYSPDDYSVNTKSTSDLVPSVHTVIQKSLETSVLSMREDVEGFETLYNNVSKRSSTKPLEFLRKHLEHPQVYIHTTEPEHQLQKVHSESSIDYSMDPSFINDSITSANTQIIKELAWI